MVEVSVNAVVSSGVVIVGYVDVSDVYVVVSVVGVVGLGAGTKSGKTLYYL